MRSGAMAMSVSRALRHPDGFCASTEASFSFLQKAVNYLLLSDAEGLFLIHAEVEDIVAAEKWLASDDSQCSWKAYLCPYAIADVTLVHLKRLKGSLLTTSLYPYFMIVAENPNIDTQLYLIRMLLYRLPGAYYSFLKDMALLWFKHSSYGSNWVHVLKLGSLFGPIFVEEDESFSAPCRYYLEIMLIPRVDKKIRVLNFKSQSSHLIQQTKQDLLLLQAACAELRGSEKFVKLLEAVLVVGNHLNGDSSRGHAKGFKLDALLKLMDVKGSNRQTTLLHFVAVELVKVDEQILCLPDELKSMRPASFVKLESIFASINDLECGLEITEEEIEFARTDLSNTSALRLRFLDSMLFFLEDCSVHVVELKDLLNITLQKLKDVFEYFGESGNEEAPRQMDLFRTMYQFLNMFHQVSKEIQEGRSSLKVEQRKVKSCNDKKAIVIENFAYSSKSPGFAMSGNDTGDIQTNAPRKNEDSIASGSADSKCGRKDQQLTSCIEEVVAKDEFSTPSKSIALHIVGYDSDWSTC